MTAPTTTSLAAAFAKVDFSRIKVPDIRVDQEALAEVGRKAHADMDAFRRAAVEAVNPPQMREIAKALRAFRGDGA